jgi:hypothetical protein
MFMTESGDLFYIRRSGTEQDVENSRKSVSAGDALVSPVGLPIHMSHGDYFCEAAWWTDWSHCGDLQTDTDCTMLALEAAELENVVSRIRGSQIGVRAASYGLAFVAHLNKLSETDSLSDVVDFHMTFSDSNSQVEKDGHLLFLSHCKKDAGTEATLMHEGIVQMIEEEPAHPGNSFSSPAFIDSEDLIDLSNLKKSVIASHNLVLLLSPELLYRPWCLVEIVTALQNGVTIVPVEIQRPGLSFRYPDESFYEAYGRGEGLTEGAVQLLKEEGIALEDLTMYIRQVFLKIALPYSPHKSGHIRQAELAVILSRCVLSREE